MEQTEVESGDATMTTPKRDLAEIVICSPDSPTLFLGENHRSYSDGGEDNHGDEVAADEVAAGEITEQELPAASFLEMEFIIDENSNYSTVNVPMSNILLPLSKFIYFCNSSFKCRECNAKRGYCYTVERYGIATSLYFECTKCGNKTACQADLTDKMEEIWSRRPPCTRFKNSRNDNRVNGADFEMNRKLYLARHQCGGGRTEGKIFAGFLGLHTNALKGRWKDIANNLGQKIIKVAKGILKENVSIKMELSPLDKTTQHKMISACGDCCWDK
jgi:hypothetical protein